MVCPKCGNKLDVFGNCNCGYEANPRIALCIKCGSKNRLGSKVCSCGAALKLENEYDTISMTFKCDNCRESIAYSGREIITVVECGNCGAQYSLLRDNGFLVFEILLEKGKSKPRKNQKQERIIINSIESAMAILEIDATSISKDKLKVFWKKQIELYHPDKVSHLGKDLKILAEEKTKEINEAYQYLLVRIGE